MAESKQLIWGQQQKDVLEFSGKWATFLPTWRRKGRQQAKMKILVKLKS